MLKSEDPSINLNDLMISENGDRLFSDPPGEYASVMRLWYRFRRRQAGLSNELALAEARAEELPPRRILPARDSEAAEVTGCMDVMDKMLRNGH